MQEGRKKFILREGSNHTSKINVSPVLHTIFFLLGGQKIDFFCPVRGKIDFYATREEEDDSDECVIVHRILIHAQKWLLLLPKTRKENPLFAVNTKNATQKIRQRQFCTNCRFSQRWSWLQKMSKKSRC